MTPEMLTALQRIETAVETAPESDLLVAEADLLREIVPPQVFEALPDLGMNLEELVRAVADFAGHSITGVSKVGRLDEGRVFIVLRWPCGIAVAYLNHGIGIGLLDIKHDGARMTARMRCVPTEAGLPPDTTFAPGWGEA